MRRLDDAKVGSVDHIVGLYDAGCQQRKVEIVSPVDRQVSNLLRLNGVRLLCALDIDNRSFGRDVDLGIELCDSHAYRQNNGIAYADLHGVDVLGLKSFGFDANTIGSWR